jgi:hypothetical protein
MSMHHYLAKLRAALRWRTIRRPSPPRKRARLQLEQLETRLAPAVSLLNHFDGLVSGAPPDTCGAAGPDSYIESVNYSAAIYNQSTDHVIASDNLNDFFYTKGGLTKADSASQLSDVTMVYDQITGQFIIASLDVHRGSDAVGTPAAPSQVVFSRVQELQPDCLGYGQLALLSDQHHRRDRVVGLPWQHRLQP